MYVCRYMFIKLSMFQNLLYFIGKRYRLSVRFHPFSKKSYNARTPPSKDFI